MSGRECTSTPGMNGSGRERVRRACTTVAAAIGVVEVEPRPGQPCAGE